jgi:predicted ABC-type ATPase
MKIDTREIDGEMATVAFINDKHELVEENEATYAKVIFENGNLVYLDLSEEEEADLVGDASWKEDLHPRGQPENKGQFGPGGGGSSASSKPRGTKSVREGDPKRNSESPPVRNATSALAATSRWGVNKEAAISRGAAAKAAERGLINEPDDQLEGEDQPAKASAAKLYQPTTKNAAQIAASVPGGEEAVKAAAERLKTQVTTDSLPEKGGFKNANGTYTPERAALHETIVQDYINPETVRQFTPKPGENPLLTILGGRGGSGKSWLTSKDGPIDTTKSLVLDADEIKSKLPEYEGWNASILHEESSDIVAMIDARAAKIGMNVVLDGTLKSENIQKRIDVYQAPPGHEYELEGYYMYASPETAATRAMGRFATKAGDFSGRFVPPEVILGNVNNEKNFDKMSEGFRKWGVYDNDADKPGEAPRLVEQADRTKQGAKGGSVRRNN